MSQDINPILGYGVNLNQLDFDEDVLKGKDIDEILRDTIDKINETTKVNLALATDDNNNSYLYIPSSVPWAFTEKEKNISETELKYLIFKVLKKYLVPGYSFERMLDEFEMIQSYYCG